MTATADRARREAHQDARLREPPRFPLPKPGDLVTVTVRGYARDVFQSTTGPILAIDYGADDPYAEFGGHHERLYFRVNADGVRNIVNHDASEGDGKARA